MTPEWFEEWLAVWPGHIAAGGPDGEEHADAIFARFHPAGVWEDVAVHASYTGQEGLRELFAGSYAWCPNLHHYPVRTQVDGRQFTIEWRMQGRGGGAFAGLPAHDLPFEIYGVSTGEVDDDGLILRHTDYWNVLDWMTQAGHLKPFGTE